MYNIYTQYTCIYTHIHLFNRNNLYYRNITMGQVHPSGPNVVKIRQRGGGQNCDCREPHFDPNEIINDPRIGGLVPQNEIREKLQAASNILRSSRKMVLYAVILMIIFSQVATVPMRFVEPGSVACNSKIVCNSTTDVCQPEACQLYCCLHPKAEKIDDDYDHTTLQNAGCSKNFTDRHHFEEQVTDRRGFKLEEKNRGCECGESDEEEDDDNYDNGNKRRELKKKNNKGKKKEKICRGETFLSGNITKRESTMWLLALFIPLMIMFTITPLIWICYNSRRSGKKIVALFKPWESLQIYTQYIHPTKHTPAWICFVLKGQYGQNNLQLVNQNQIRVVQQNQQQQGQIMMAPYSQSPQQQGQVMMAPYSQPPQQQGNMMRGGQQVGMQMQPQGQVMQVRQGQMIQPQGQVMEIRQGQMIQPQGPVIQGQMIQPQSQVIQGQMIQPLQIQSQHIQQQTVQPTGNNNRRLI